MTACVNKKHSRRVAAAISASLVGALTLGAAPVLAVAEEAPVQVQVADDAFSRGTVTLTGAGALTNGVYSVNADKDGKALDIKATQVKPLGADPIVVTDAYTVSYYKADDDFNKVGGAIATISEPGKYLVGVSDGAGHEAFAKVAVKALTLTGIDFYEADADDPYAVSDKDLYFTGSALDVRFQVSGVYLVEGEDYTVKIIKKGTDNVPDAAVDEVLGAGDYVGYVTGLGQYADDTKEVQFTVNKFVYKDENVTVADVIASNTKPVHPTKVTNGETGSKYAELDPSLVDLAFVSGPTVSTPEGPKPSNLFDKIGAYQFKATPNAEQVLAGNIDASAEVPGTDKNVTVNKVAEAATFQYDGTAIQDSYLVNLAEGDSFDYTKIAVYNGKTKLAQGAGYTVTVTDTSGTPGYYGALSAGTPGTYVVTVKANPSDASVDYAVGGSVTFTVQVVEDVLDADATVYVYYNGEAITSYTKNYDGTALYAGDFTAKIFDEDGNTVTDSSLKLVLCDSDGNPLGTGSSIQHAGSYILKVTSTNYKLTGTTELPITINKVDLSTLDVFALVDYKGAEYLPLKSGTYRWDDFDLRYNTGIADDDDTDAYNDGKAWDRVDQLADFSSEDSVLTCEKWDDEKGEWVKVTDWTKRCTTEGMWRLTLTGTRELARDYTFANDDNTTSVEFHVVDPAKIVFEDVTPDAWYFDVVYEASKAGNEWMNGYAGTKLFGPTASITRGQVACVLYNLASAAGQVDETDLAYNEVEGYLNGFTDVNGKAYYGKAIAWAEQAGVVNGYADGAFRPDQTVTRQEFACMLANYAKKTLEFEAAGSDALEGFADAGQVAEFAEESVAWAVKNGIMGNGGSIAPASQISRAETAAMVVNFESAK